jgi:hypothetical protein
MQQVTVQKVLNCDSCTNLGRELNLQRDQQNSNTGTKELLFTLLGGSNLKNTKLWGVEVVDLMHPGWVANTANSQVMRQGTEGGVVYAFSASERIPIFRYLSVRRNSIG